MLQIVLKSLIVYFLVLIILRFMGKREIGQLSLFDFVVLLLIADISVIGIENSDGYIYAIPVVLLAVIQKTLAKISLKFPKLRSLIDGKPSIIIFEGKLNIKEMKKQQYNIDDLIVQIRLKNIKSLSQIKYLILETNGEVSIITNKSTSLGANTKSRTSSIVGGSSVSEAINETNNNDNIYPFPLIVSGVAVEENLTLLKIDKKWLQRKIEEQGYKSISEIYYANYENDQLFIVQTM